MDIREFLAAQGLTEEEAQAVVGNEKQAKAFNAALSKYEEGTKNLADTEKFWEEKTVELQRYVDEKKVTDGKYAQAEAERARYATYLKSLKDQGYDVPDSLVASAPASIPEHTSSPNDSNYMTRDDFGKFSRSVAPDLVTLTALSNEYQSLYGQPYVGVQQDFEEWKAKGMRGAFHDYAKSKNNFDGKRNEISAAKEKERIDALVSEQVKNKEKELAEKYGANPDTRAPMPSRFARLEKELGDSGKESWKSVDGRKANTQARREKFANAFVQ